jgi:hypothetical protein
MLTAETLCRKHGELVIEDQQNWLDQRRDYYRFCAPYRDPKLWGSAEKGPRRPNEVFDATAVVACQRGAGRLQRGLVPDEENWITLVPGPLVKRADRERTKRILDDVTGILRGLLGLEGFGLAIGELFVDLFAGEGALLVLRGDEAEPVKYAAVPPEHVQTIDDSYGRTKTWIYCKKIAVEEILRDWPKARLTKELAKQLAADPGKEVELLLSCEKLGAWSYAFKVIDKERKTAIWEEPLRTSPFITPRMFKTPGQRRGAGPPLLAMPTIKTLNKSVEFELKAAAFAILGAWMTTDDGVYNPRTASLSPGGMLKVNSNGGPRGPSMMRMDIPSNFDLSRIVSQELRVQIKEMLMDDDLPSPTDSVRSPTEIVERLKRLVQHIAGAFGRLFAELIVPLVQRVLDIADQFGLLPERVQADGLLVKTQVISPLANAQMLEDVQKVVQWIEIMAQTLGPQEAQVQIDPDQVGPFLQEKLGAPVTLLRDAGERKKVRTQLQQAAQQAYEQEAQKAAREHASLAFAPPQRKAA